MNFIDLHAHPGNMQELDYEPQDIEDRAERLPYSTAGRLLEVDGLKKAGVLCLNVSSVSDTPALGLAEDGSIVATRDFEPGEAYRHHLKQLDAIHRGLERSGVKIVKTAGDLICSEPSNRLLALIGCEGAHFVEQDLDRLDEAYAMGVRTVCLVHYKPNQYGDAQGSAPVFGGLSDLGRSVIARMNELGMVVDCAHASYETARDMAAVSDAPIMLSHSHLTGGTGRQFRLISKEHAQLIADAGGIIGAWPSGFVCRNLDDFADQVMRLIDVVGVSHVAMGTDMDGNYNPVMARYDQIGDLADLLTQRGASDNDLSAVFEQNAIRLFRSIL